MALDLHVLNGSNDMRLAVACNEPTGHIVLRAALDNLGKGVALQNLRLLAGAA